MPRRTSLPAESEGVRLQFEHRSFYRLSLLATQVNRAVGQAYVTMHGRPANGWKVITTLGRFGPMSTSRIHELTTLEMDRVTRIVDALVISSLAVRKQDDLDRRRVIVSLSAKGKALNLRIERMIAKMEKKFLEVLSRSERDVLYDFLERLQAQGRTLSSPD